MSIVKLDVTHSNLSMTMPELKFDLSQTIGEIKTSLEKRVGTNADNMDLILKDGSGNTICTLSNDEESLGSYGPQNGYILHVIDTNPLSITKQLSEENSDVPMYKIEEDKYHAREDTFEKFKQKNPELFKGKDKSKTDPEFEADKAAEIKIGDRCQILKTKARGEVKYIGKIPEKAPGYWVGVLLDEPLGNSNGKYILMVINRLKGTTYFTAEMKYGVFERPSGIEVGDFPPEDIDEI